MSLTQRAWASRALPAPEWGKVGGAPEPGSFTLGRPGIHLDRASAANRWSHGFPHLSFNGGGGGGGARNLFVSSF